MIDLGPPPLVFPMPTIIRPVEGGLWGSMDADMARDGVPRHVRRAIIAEVKRTLGGRYERGAFDDLSAWARTRGAPVTAGLNTARKLLMGADGETDPYFSSVQLLLHGDGADASTTFTDSGPVGWSPTVGGNAQIDTAQSVFGGASMLFDGSGDKLTYSSASAMAPGTGDFTLEAWVRFPSSPGSFTIFAGAATGGFGLFRDGGNWKITAVGNSDPQVAASTVNTNTWYWMVAQRSGTTLSIYQGGARLGTATSSYNFGTSTYYVGVLNSNTYYMNGWIEELRWTKGVARYSGTSITVQSAPWPDA